MCDFACCEFGHILHCGCVCVLRTVVAFQGAIIRLYNFGLIRGSIEAVCG